MLEATSADVAAAGASGGIPDQQSGPSRKGLHASGPVLRSGTLHVGDGFRLFYEELGAVDGLHAVFLHGGPGAGCSRRMAQLFDPSKYRIVLVDQRGCGKSRRPGTDEDQLAANTTWHLVEDLEALRVHLKIDRWLIGGGSWGTCLALAYASRHADKVSAMVLRAVCLFREEEFDFFLGPGPGARTVCGDAWNRLTDWLPWVNNRTSARIIAAAFRRAALGKDSSLSREDAISKWLQWEMQLMTASEPPEPLTRSQVEQRIGPDELPPPCLTTSSWPNPVAWFLNAVAGNMTVQVLLTMHYVVERGFLLPGFELLDAARLFDFPLEIVHGRKDCVCPAKNARDLAAAVPRANLRITDAGHSQWENENIDAFVDATDRLEALVQAQS